MVHDKVDSGSPREEAVTHVLNIEDEEEILEFVSGMYDMLDEVLC